MFLFRMMALPMACLIVLLSLSSVCPALHDSVFHGKEGCPHAGGDHSCGSHDKQDDREENGQTEPPCLVLLLAKGFLFGDYQPDLTFSNTLVSEPGFFVFSSTWVLRKNDPFGARDPPSLA